ncbi:MAG TPA: PH domain-containing protein [Phycisphaerae bacterium]|nr:PH domain-containing protein [Phycisphaerae bacterium]
MNYQITCFCGNRFLITDQQLHGPVNCPACKRPLQPMVAENPPPSPQPEPTPATPVPSPPSDAEATKRCPFCGEVILAVAKKCKHCGEFLDRSLAPANATNTPAAPAADIPPVFSLSVSQWDNFWKFVICATLVVLTALVLIEIPSLRQYAPIGICSSLAIMGFIAWLLYLSVKNSRCYIRPNRIDTEVGIFSKEINSIELFRITDLELKQGIVQRLLRIGTIHITSSDPNAPNLVLYQIPQARKVHKYLQDQIPIATRQRGAMFVEK